MAIVIFRVTRKRRGGNWIFCLVLPSSPLLLVAAAAAAAAAIDGRRRRRRRSGRQESHLWANEIWAKSTRYCLIRLKRFALCFCLTLLIGAEPGGGRGLGPQCHGVLHLASIKPGEKRNSKKMSLDGTRLALERCQRCQRHRSGRRTDRADRKRKRGPTTWFN